jgi:hypothetical protein
LEKIFKPPPRIRQVKKCHGRNGRNQGLQGRILQHRTGASTTSMVNPAAN